MDTFFGKFQKKVILICSMVIVLVLFTGYLYFNYQDLNTEDDEEKIPSYDIITKINIELSPDMGHMDDYEISDKKDIETIVDSLNSIHATGMESHLNDSYGGSGYHLEFHVQNKQIVDILLLGTLLIVDGKKWEVSYEKASDFNRIMAGIIYKQYQNDQSYDCLKGKVTELYNQDAHIKDAEGFEVLSRKRICIIDTDNKKIDVSYSYIFNFQKNEGFFSGPEKGDQVEIYLKAGEENAKAIFVSNHQ